jgi:hypothetical protein
MATCLARDSYCCVSSVHCRQRKMLVRVPARAELVTALALGQAWEAPAQARVWGWAERPARQQLVWVLVT